MKEQKEIKVTAELKEAVEAELKVPDPTLEVALAKIECHRCTCKNKEHKNDGDA